jgi:nickel-type superoxide dismutase maturation protease
MNRKTRRRVLRAVAAVPGFYNVLAFAVARRVIVRGRSMLPTLRPGERVLFDRLAYVSHRPRSGDIVLARHPDRPGLRMIKRAVTAGPDLFLLLGDNPDESTDGRQLGPVRRRDILARGWLVYWPPERVRQIHRAAWPKKR